MGKPFIGIGIQSFLIPTIGLGILYVTINKTLFPSSRIYYDLNDEEI